MDNKNICISSGCWGNLYLEADFRKVDLLPRVTLSRVSRHAFIFLVGFLVFDIQLTIWSKAMRSVLKEDSHDTV